VAGLWQAAGAARLVASTAAGFRRSTGRVARRLDVGVPDQLRNFVGSIALPVPPHLKNFSTNLNTLYVSLQYYLGLGSRHLSSELFRQQYACACG
jgi:hypothetical protein